MKYKCSVAYHSKFTDTVKVFCNRVINNHTDRAKTICPRSIDYLAKKCNVNSGQKKTIGNLVIFSLVSKSISLPWINIWANHLTFYHPLCLLLASIVTLRQIKAKAILKHNTLSQMTDVRHFRTERVCRS